jgi:FixJ family two-component response regulator
MPGMNGIDLAEAICATRAETRVLLMSGYMDLHESLAKQVSPGVDFLAKPFETDDLTALVRRVLDAPTPG